VVVSVALLIATVKGLVTVMEHVLVILAFGDQVVSV
jgi:hypothetical protein